MRITSIPQIYRHLNRWREMLWILSKYELAAWIGRLGPNFAKDLLKARGGQPVARHPWETRVRLALAELGPTFVKLGQVLSTRPDLVGVALADELTHLQTDVPADPPETVRATIEAELGRPVDELFDEFEDTPIASASIGQVHRARLKSGKPVVVKVQHADIQRRIRVDLDILAGLAQRADRVPEFHNYRPTALVAEFKRSLRHELDFHREERTMQHFARNFADNPALHVPKTYPKLCSSRVLTMELIEGIRLSERERLKQRAVDLAELARRGADVYLEMVFNHGLYHADPHPGNLLVLDGHVIGLLDYGMVGRIDEQLHEDMAELLVAISGQDPEHLTSIIVRLGSTPPDLDRTALCLDLADFVSHYGGLSLDRFDLSGALREITEMVRRHGIILDARIAMLIKTFVSLEGTSRMLTPDFSLIEVMRPYRKRILWRRLSPGRKLRKLRRFLGELEHMISVLPREIIELLDQIQTGKFDVHLDHRGLEPSVNRLVLGMLASALFLGSSLLLSRQVSPTFSFPLLAMKDISALGAAGAVASLFLGWRVWRAINRSGRLDRH